MPVGKAVVYCSNVPWNAKRALAMPRTCLLTLVDLGIQGCPEME